MPACIVSAVQITRQAVREAWNLKVSRPGPDVRHGPSVGIHGVAGAGEKPAGDEGAGAAGEEDPATQVAGLSETAPAPGEPADRP